MKSAWRAGHLPGLSPRDVAWLALPFSAHGQTIEIEVPRLSASQMQALARHVKRSAREVLQNLSVNAIIEILDRAVARLLDLNDPIRREADHLLPIITGFDAQMVQLGLSAYLQSFRGPQLHRFVAEDFANPKVLDGFQPAMKGGAVRAIGPQLLVHSWAGNVPGLPMWSLVCGLLVKAGNIGKLPSSEPIFASLLAKVLAEVHPPLADCLAVVWWNGAEPEPAASLYREAEVVLAYGSDAAIHVVRDLVPVSTRFIGYGHKLGLSMVARAALDMHRGPALARLAALDFVRWEQQGCYSPHMIYVERGAALSARAFAQHVSAELASLEQRHPRRALSIQEAASVAQWRQAAEWRAISQRADGVEISAQISTVDGRGDAVAPQQRDEYLGSEQSSWALSFSERALPLMPSPGYRCVTVSAVDSLDEVIPLLQAHSAFLQTVGLATTPDELYRLAEALARVGVTRIAPIGSLAQPEAGWHHDGRFNLADLVRMVEIEQASERAADRLAPYAQEGTL